jgi:poly(3-hydroxybutyrate) depolymerase
MVAVVGVVAVRHWSVDHGPDLLFESFTSSNGLTSQYHLFGSGVPVDGPVGVLVQFHGDGAYEFHHPGSAHSLGGPSGIVAAAEEHGLLVLAVLSPDRHGTVTWWEDGEDNAEFVRDLLEQELFARFDIDRSDIWLVGFSGGAQFITQFLLPRHPSLLEGGGAILFGGGGAPRVEPAPFPPDLTARFTMHWYTGADDRGTAPEWYDALTDAHRGRRWYDQQGFRTTFEAPAGVGHDGLPFGEVVAQQLDDDLMTRS